MMNQNEQNGRNSYKSIRGDNGKDDGQAGEKMMTDDDGDSRTSPCVSSDIHKAPANKHNSSRSGGSDIDKDIINPKMIQDEIAELKQIDRCAYNNTPVVLSPPMTKQLLSLERQRQLRQQTDQKHIKTDSGKVSKYPIASNKIISDWMTN